MEVMMTKHALSRAMQRCQMNAKKAKEDAKTAILLNSDVLLYAGDGAKEVSGDVGRWVVMENGDGDSVVITCKGYRISKRGPGWFEKLTGRSGFRRGPVRK